ncbi:MAG: glutamate 5-kinase [Chlorobi bacterium]|nr:glutamate 5-kinase [Chlorobiota bacterium]
MAESITIKIGSNVLTADNGSLDMQRIEHLADQISMLHKQGKRIVLVSSGAVAAGRGMVRLTKKTDPVTERQVLSSTGQVKLMAEYTRLFEERGISIAQVLVTKQDFRTREHYLNMKNCIAGLWNSRILPVVNENDAISVTALMFTDNDELAGLMASMMNCDSLFILSNVNGIYDGDPSLPESKVIRNIGKDKLTDIYSYISSEKSDFGRGGMITKCRIAVKTAESGVSVHIANGKKKNIILDLSEQPENVEHTRFAPGGKRPAIKKWIAYSDGFAKAEVVINRGAKAALTSDKATSLLLPGVVKLKGEFYKGDLLKIIDEEGNPVGIGKASYSRQKAEEHKKDKKYKPLIHYDYLYLY